MDEKIEFLSDGINIEGIINRGVGTKGVVITHPHPQYGGDMYNPVVESIGHAYQQKGITTLRFNFRGVGFSGGSYAGGIGEQEDVRAAIACLQALDMTDIDLAGYSFGAWVNAHIQAQTVPIRTMIMVSPPVALMDFDSDLALPRLSLVVSGSQDEIAPAGNIRNLMPTWNPDAVFEEIQGADHFFSGCFEALGTVLSRNIQ